MTHRQRFQALMLYQPIDQLPVVAMEPWENDTLARWRGEGLPADADPVAALGMCNWHRFYTHMGPIPSFPRRVLFEDETTIVETDGLNTTVRRLKSNPSMYYGHIDHPVKTMADWLEYKKRLDPHSPGRLTADTAAWIEQLNASADPVGWSLYPFFFRMGFYLMGMDRFLTAFYDEPPLIHDFFAHWAYFFSEHLTWVLPKLQLDWVDFAEDLAFKSAPHISPAVYQEFWLPHQVPIIQQLQAAHVPVIAEYTAGNIECLLPVLLDHGINAAWTLEQQAGMDPVKLRQRFGRRLGLGGGFPKEALIAGPAAIDREIARLLPLIRAGGYLPACDDMVPPEVSWETYRYYIRAMQAIRLT